MYTFGIIVLLIIIYRNVQEIKKNTNRKALPFSVILALSILILFIPLLTTLLPIFIIYRQIIDIFLRINYRSKYIGLVKGADAFHTVEDSGHNVAHALLIMKVQPKCRPEEFFKNIQAAFWKLTYYPKFTSIFLKRFGYSYMIKGDLTKDDCIRKMKTVNCKNEKIEKEEFSELLNESINSPVNKNQTISWEMLVGVQPLKWKEDEYNYYPVLFRINHAVADGVTMCKLLAGAIGDLVDMKVEKVIPNPNTYHCGEESRELSKKMFLNLYDKVKLICETLRKGLKAIILAPSAIIVNFMLKGKDSNILQGPQLSGKKVLVFSVEESSEYFEKTKKIKNKLPGTAFPDVLFAAFSASLNDYFKKKSILYPEYITGTIPLVPGSSSLSKLIPGEYNRKPVKVINGYSLVLMNLPLYIRKGNDLEEDTSLITKLELIRKEADIIKNSVDYQVAYFVISVICGLLPHPLIKLLMNIMHCTTVLSIIPGPPKVTYCKESVVMNNVIAWVPHLHNIGVTFLVNTYMGRLHLGLSVDETLISDRNDAQNIVDGVFKYLDVLEKEVDCGF